MADNNTQVSALSNRNAPNPIAPNTYGPVRSTKFGEVMTSPLGANKNFGYSDEGSYFFAQQPVIDAATTVAGHPAPVLANLYTKPFVHLINGDVVTSTKRVYLDFIWIQVNTPGASGTSDNWAAECDTGASRYSSGTVTKMTAVCPNMQSTNAPILTANLGPMVAVAATTAQRKMGNGVFRPTIAIAGDQYLFVFGGLADNISVPVAGAVARHIVPMPPVILGPTDQFLLHLYAPSQASAAVYQVMAGWVER